MQERSMYCMEMLVWYVTLVGLAVSACDYGEPICPGDEKTINWQCPDGQKLVVQAFWGREPGDGTSCIAGQASGSQRTTDCPGDDEKALAAATAWCDADVNANGECVVKAPTQKLRYNGEKYDPCPGVLKYLKVCTECECIEDPNGVIYDAFNHTLPVVRIKGTSKKDMAIVEGLFTSASIITTEGNFVVQLRDPVDGALYMDIARQGDILFIPETKVTSNDTIHVIKEDGTYITAIQTDVQFIRCLVVVGNKIIVGTSWAGLFELTFDTSYNIISKVLLVAPSATFGYPFRIHATESHLVVLCLFTQNVHFLYHNGTAMFPPVGGSLLIYPFDFDLDSCGQLYVLDSLWRVLVFSKDGTFIEQVPFTGEEELPLRIGSIFIQYDNMYLGSRFVPKVAAIELQ